MILFAGEGFPTFSKSLNRLDLGFEVKTIQGLLIILFSKGGGRNGGHVCDCRCTGEVWEG